MLYHCFINQIIYEYSCIKIKLFNQLIHYDMNKNKYQKRRGIRPSASTASATQAELLQGPIQLPSATKLSNDLARETARQRRENPNPKAPPSNLVFKGGGVHYKPAMKGNLMTAVADVISDNVIHPLIGNAFGKDIPKVEELRHGAAIRIKDNGEVAANDAFNAAQRQRRLQAAQVPIG